LIFRLTVILCPSDLLFHLTVPASQPVDVIVTVVETFLGTLVGFATIENFLQSVH
jgi:hypothetical protein